MARDARQWVNWAGNQRSFPAEWRMASCDDDVVKAVGDAVARGLRVRAVGSGHSFSGVAVPEEVLVDVSRLDHVGRVVATPDGTGVVDVGAGVTLAKLNDELHRQGWAMPNLGDIVYQTVAGAVSSGTHGTGVSHKGLAAQVESLTLIDGAGALRRIADGDELRCACLSLGSMGVITSLRLRVVPSFVLEAVESTARLEEVLENLEAHAGGNEHFEFFWIPHTKRVRTKHNNRVDGGPRPLGGARHWFEKSFMENTAFGAVCRVGKRMPALVPRVAPLLAASGTTTYADWSHKVFASERRVRFLEMEYALPVERCAEALRSVDTMIRDRDMRIGFPVEVRFAAADDIPLSTAYGRTTAYVAVHMFRGVDHREYFRGVEAIMTDLEGRPHWGKMHERTAPSLADAYPEWGLFGRVRREFDPDGIFLNRHLVSVLGGG